MIFVLLLIILIYVVTIWHLIDGFNRIKTFHATPKTPSTFFSIVVVFRNESENLPQLLDSIKNLNYPIDLFEIILVDDLSEDDSTKKIYEWRMQNGSFQTTLLENIRLSNSPKKDAISRAVPIAQQEWLVTTDADCLVPTDWLRTLDQYIHQNDVNMIAGPVTFDVNKSFLQQFQRLDLTSLQGTTIGSFGIDLAFMCNGANLCYTKELFQDIHGFAGNKKIASGDDVFLLQKAVRKNPEKVHFLKSKEFIVQSKPEKTWSRLFQQRVRWASKTKAYSSLFGKDLAVIVFATNLVLVLSLFLEVYGSPISLLGFELPRWSFVGTLFLLKFTVDFILLEQTNRFLLKKRMRYLFFSSLFYPFFCVVVAVFSWFGKYDWKGRTF